VRRSSGGQGPYYWNGFVSTVKPSVADSERVVTLVEAITSNAFFSQSLRVAPRWTLPLVALGSVAGGISAITSGAIIMLAGDRFTNAPNDLGTV